jgi:hypothetical protein
MRAVERQACKLHAPAKDEDYRKHLYEAHTLCHRTGWIALAEGQVTCSRCLRKLERERARRRAKQHRRVPVGDGTQYLAA